MLDSVPQAQPSPASSRHRFAFAGVAFEVLSGDGVAWELPERCAQMCTPIHSSEVVADVICAVRAGHAAAVRRPALRHGEVCVAAPGVSASIRALGAHRYAMAALIASDDLRACERLLTLATSTVARLER
jgi:hypothetical protein